MSSTVRAVNTDSDFDTWIQVIELEQLDTSQMPAETCSRSWIQMHLDFSCSIGSKSLGALQLQQVVQSTRAVWATPFVQSGTYSIGSRSEGINKTQVVSQHVTTSPYNSPYKAALHH